MLSACCSGHSCASAQLWVISSGLRLGDIVCAGVPHNGHHGHGGEALAAGGGAGLGAAAAAHHHDQRQ